MNRYLLSKVDVKLGERHSASWEFAREPVSGTEYLYDVTDYNFASRNRWSFSVRAPKDRRDRIEIRPQRVPNRLAWAGLDRRTITFSAGTRSGYRDWVYCQISLADPTGRRTRDVIRMSQRRQLPSWFSPLDGRLSRKDTVVATTGRDRDELVVRFRPDDHTAMIRTFFVTKVWILSEGVVVD